jgi:serine phosphatase RsbU (regulator of sigma subunit)
VVEFELRQLDDRRRNTLRWVAALLASELASRGQYTDAVTRARRTATPTLAAEIQRMQLPPPSFRTSDVTVATAVEPAYNIAGDVYDYAHNDRVLHAAMLDAVGHDLEATLIAVLLLGTYRWCRRRDVDLEATAATMDAAVREQFPDASYGTGVLLELDVDTGVVRWINNGHPPPLLLREHNIVGELEAERRPPLGFLDVVPVTGKVASTQLQPDDRVLLYTDGLSEVRDGGFGIADVHELLHRALSSDLPAAEMVRRLIHAVLDHHDGFIEDDASVMLVHWHPHRDETG